MPAATLTVSKKSPCVSAWAIHSLSGNRDTPHGGQLHGVEQGAMVYHFGRVAQDVGDKAFLHGFVASQAALYEPKRSYNALVWY
jgi:hypothetical protein